MVCQLWRCAAAGRAVIAAAAAQDPQGIAIDSAGKIFISDQGNSNQVKEYAQDGRLLKTFGQAGPLEAGAYNQLHMNHPKGIALDSNGKLWVAEDDLQPKRLSIWNPDGTLLRAFYGPPQYGGGIVIDRHDPSRFFYYGMEFHVDLLQRKQNLVRIYHRRGLDSTFDANSSSPDMPLEFGGHRYFTDAFNTATFGATIAFLYLDKGDVAVPVAGFGRAQDWDVLKQPPYRYLWPPGTSPRDSVWQHPAAFVWSDLNGNGKPDPQEIVIRAGWLDGITMSNDGSFLVSNLAANSSSTGHALLLPPIRITELGVPVYDFAKAITLAPSQRSPSDGGQQVLTGSNGWLVQTTAPPPYSNFGLGGSKNGVPQWSYPSPWPGLHASHNSPGPDRPGMLVGTTHLLGGIVDHPKAGPLFFLNGNQGNIYVFTQDGLFVSQLFQDVRQGQLWEMPSEQPNALLNELTLHDENFFPSVTQTPNGKVYLVAGAIPAVVRVDGLDTIERLPPSKIEISVDELRQCQETLSESKSSIQGHGGAKLLKVFILPTAAALDGNPENLQISAWAPIDTRGAGAWFNPNTKAYDVKGGILVAGTNLIAAWETGEPETARQFWNRRQYAFPRGRRTRPNVANRSESTPGSLRARQGRSEAIRHPG